MAVDDLSLRISAQISSAMQVIAAVPMFEGRGCDLDYFIRRMDVIVQQIDRDHLDDVATKYILGYFYSRISAGVLREIGVTWETTWDQTKVLLRAKYGGTSTALPRFILREVLMEREGGQGSGEFAKAVRDGLRKARARLLDEGHSTEEVRIRATLLEELAAENILCNLNRRVKQWVAIKKPTSFEAMVEAIIEEEREDREERSRQPKRSGVSREVVPWREAPVRRTRDTAEWQPVASRRPRQTRQHSYRPTQGRGSQERRPRREAVVRPARQCWECREEGHLARDCPYMFRREQRAARRPQQYDEPMDVNVTSRRRLLARKRHSGSDVGGSETDSSSGSSATRRTDQSGRSWADRVKRQDPQGTPEKRVGRRGQE